MFDWIFAIHFLPLSAKASISGDHRYYLKQHPEDLDYIEKLVGFKYLKDVTADTPMAYVILNLKANVTRVFSLSNKFVTKN